MSNYTKATNFATKDSLATGNPAKIVKGTEIDTEFNAISSAIASKADLASPTFTGTPAAPTATAGSNTTQLANTAYVKAAIDAIGSTGKIVQTVSSIYTSSTSTTNSSYVSTGHTLTITPTSTSSKILILQTGKLFQTDEYQPSQNALLTIYRNSTNLATGTESFIQASSGYANSIYIGESMTYLDSPATTSATSYTVYMRIAGSQANAVYAGVASLIALEIL